MITIYLKDGSEIQRDGIDARDYVRAGLATYEKPEPEQPVEVVAEEKPRRGRPAKE